MDNVREGVEPEGRHGGRGYMRWMRKRNISLVLTVIIIAVLFWILIGWGMGRKHEGVKEEESKVVT